VLDIVFDYFFLFCVLYFYNKIIKITISHLSLIGCDRTPTSHLRQMRHNLSDSATLRSSSIMMLSILLLLAMVVDAVTVCTHDLLVSI